MLTQLGSGFLTVVFCLALASCGGGGSSSFSDDGGGVTVFNPSQPGAQFTRNSDPAAAVGQRDRMWQTMTNTTCWDASFVGDPTIAGTVASVSQFQFFGQFQYRHVGFSTNFGSVLLHDVGYHNGLDTAIVETWTGDIEAFVIVNPTTLAHVLKKPSGVPFISYYRTSSTGCL